MLDKIISVVLNERTYVPGLYRLCEAKAGRLIQFDAYDASRAQLNQLRRVLLDLSLSVCGCPLLNRSAVYFNGHLLPGFYSFDSFERGDALTFESIDPELEYYANAAGFPLYIIEINARQLYYFFNLFKKSHRAAARYLKKLINRI